MAPSERSYTTSYQSVLVYIALSCTIFEIFYVEEYRDLEICYGYSPYELVHAQYVAEIFRSGLSFCRLGLSSFTSTASS